MQLRDSISGNNRASECSADQVQSPLSFRKTSWNAVFNVLTDGGIAVRMFMRALTKMRSNKLDFFSQISWDVVPQTQVDEWFFVWFKLLQGFNI